MEKLKVKKEKMKVYNSYTSKKWFYSAFLMIGLPLWAFAGGAWPSGAGHGYIKVSEWFTVADQHYTDTGDLDPNVTIGVYNTNLYGEYGVTDNLTLIGYIPIFSRTFFNNTVSKVTGDVILPGESLNGIGDLDLRLKYTFLNAGIVASIQGGIGLPLGKDSGGSLGNLQTGDGETNFLGRVDLSKSFAVGSNSGYVSLYGGYNKRSKGFSDELHFGVEGGMGLGSRFWVIARLYGVQSRNNGNSTDVPIGTSLFSNNAEFLSFSPELSYQLTSHIGIAASIGTALSGKIILARPSYEFGVFVKW